MKLGMVSALLDKDMPAAFARAQRLGFAGLELPLSTADMQDIDGWIARTRALMTRHKLAVPSLMLGEHNAGSLSSPDPARLKKCEADVVAAIRMAKGVEAKNVLVAFFFDGRVEDDRGFNQVVAAFRRLCPVAAEQGVNLLYEGELPSTEIVRMCEAVGAENFGCYFDLGNAVWLGRNAASEARGLGRWLKALHMKDSRVGPGDVRPGKGRVDYAEAAVALKELGYDGWLVMETPTGSDEEIAGDMAFCRTVFPSIEG